MTTECWQPRAEAGLTMAEALEAAVCGYRVASPSIQADAYVDYQGQGWRINYPGGSSSGFTFRDEDEAAEWHIVPLPSEVKRDAWGKPIGTGLINLSDPPKPKSWDEVNADMVKTEGGWRSRDKWGR